MQVDTVIAPIEPTPARHDAVPGSPYLSVVIPTYNEANRLPATLENVVDYLSRQPYAWEVLISDDGSRDQTRAIAHRYAAQWPQVRVLTGSLNRGKGSAVRRGVLAARGTYVLFSDADLATPIEDIEKLLPFLQSEFDVSAGSRVTPDANVTTKQSPLRQLMGKTFRRFVRRLALKNIQDTQCGFKAFHATTARHIFAQLQTEGFAFDVEVLLLAEALGYRIKEVGVTWADRPGTTVSPLRDAWRMLRDIRRLRNGVRQRLENNLQSVPGDDDPGIALLTLTNASAQGALPHDLLTADGRHTGNVVTLEEQSRSVLIALFAISPREARMTATELAASATARLADAGTSGLVSDAVQILPLATPITWLREQAGDPAAMPLGDKSELLTKLHIQQEARDADLHAFDQRREEWRQRRRILHPLIVANLLGMVWWLSWLYNYGHAANYVLYTFLVIAETFSVTQVLGYWYTVWHEREPERKRARVQGRVDVFITTYNEPVEMVEQTVRAAVTMPYPHRTYVLDDGNRTEMGEMAKRLGAQWITRADNRGAKAGNINHALYVTDGDFFVVFDADHSPHPDFLSRMMPFMDDSRMGVVQAPQYYMNRDKTYIAGGAMDQQEIFFGPICRGKDGLGAVFCCGTNMVVRRMAIDEVGGFREDSITEDAATSLDLHERGWRSRYVPERLAEGLAPEDLGAYISQQHRWARGNLEMLFRFRVPFRRMPLSLRLQYMWSAMYYLTGLTTPLYLALPVLFLLFGTQSVSANSGDFIGHFLPYIFVTIFILARSAEGRLHFRAIQLGYGLFPVFLSATLSAVAGRKVGFHVTSKQRSAESFYRLVKPQIGVVVISLIAIVVGFMHYSGARTITNASWAFFDIVMLSAIIRAAAPQRVEAGEAMNDSNTAGDMVTRSTA